MAERRTLETILTENQIVSEEQLKQIIRYAHAVGIDLYEAVLQKKVAPPDEVMMAYAESVGLPFVHLDDVTVDEEVAAQVAPMIARQHSYVPVSIDHGYVWVITTKPLIPDVADELRMIFTLPVRCALCTPSELSSVIARYYPRDTPRIDKAERSKILPPQPHQPQPVAKQREPIEPMNPAELKNRVMATVATFNFTVAAVWFAFFYLPVLKRLGYSSYMLALISLVIGGLAAFTAWQTLRRHLAPPPSTLV